MKDGHTETWGEDGRSYWNDHWHMDLSYKLKPRDIQYMSKLLKEFKRVIDPETDDS